MVVCFIGGIIGVGGGFVGKSDPVAGGDGDEAAVGEEHDGEDGECSGESEEDGRGGEACGEAFGEGDAEDGAQSECGCEQEGADDGDDAED